MPSISTPHTENSPQVTNNVEQQSTHVVSDEGIATDASKPNSTSSSINLESTSPGEEMDTSLVIKTTLGVSNGTPLPNAPTTAVVPSNINSFEGTTNPSQINESSEEATTGQEESVAVFNSTSSQSAQDPDSSDSPSQSEEVALSTKPTTKEDADGSSTDPSVSSPPTAPQTTAAKP